MATPEGPSGFLTIADFRADAEAKGYTADEAYAHASKAVKGDLYDDVPISFSDFMPAKEETVAPVDDAVDEDIVTTVKDFRDDAAAKGYTADEAYAHASKFVKEDMYDDVPFSFSNFMPAKPEKDPALVAGEALREAEDVGLDDEQVSQVAEALDDFAGYAQSAMQAAPGVVTPAVIQEGFDPTPQTVPQLATKVVGQLQQSPIPGVQKATEEQVAKAQRAFDRQVEESMPAPVTTPQAAAAQLRQLRTSPIPGVKDLADEAFSEARAQGLAAAKVAEDHLELWKSATVADQDKRTKEVLAGETAAARDLLIEQAETSATYTDVTNLAEANTPIVEQEFRSIRQQIDAAAKPARDALNAKRDAEISSRLAVAPGDVKVIRSEDTAESKDLSGQLSRVIKAADAEAQKRDPIVLQLPERDADGNYVFARDSFGNRRLSLVDTPVVYVGERAGHMEFAVDPKERPSFEGVTDIVARVSRTGKISYPEKDKLHTDLLSVRHRLSEARKISGPGGRLKELRQQARTPEMIIKGVDGTESADTTWAKGLRGVSNAEQVLMTGDVYQYDEVEKGMKGQTLLPIRPDNLIVADQLLVEELRKAQGLAPSNMMLVAQGLVRDRTFANVAMALQAVKQKALARQALSTERDLEALATGDPIIVSPSTADSISREFLAEKNRDVWFDSVVPGVPLRAVTRIGSGLFYKLPVAVSKVLGRGLSGVNELLGMSLSPEKRKEIEGKLSEARAAGKEDLIAQYEKMLEIDTRSKAQTELSDKEWEKYTQPLFDHLKLRQVDVQGMPSIGKAFTAVGQSATDAVRGMVDLGGFALGFTGTPWEALQDADGILGRFEAEVEHTGEFTAGLTYGVVAQTLAALGLQGQERFEQVWLYDPINTFYAIKPLVGPARSKLAAKLEGMEHRAAERRKAAETRTWRTVDAEKVAREQQQQATAALGRLDIIDNLLESQLLDEDVVTVGAVDRALVNASAKLSDTGGRAGRSLSAGIKAVRTAKEEYKQGVDSAAQTDINDTIAYTDIRGKAQEAVSALELVFESAARGILNHSTAHVDIMAGLKDANVDMTPKLSALMASGKADRVLGLLQEVHRAEFAVAELRLAGDLRAARKLQKKRDSLIGLLDDDGMMKSLLRLLGPDIKKLSAKEKAAFSEALPWARASSKAFLVQKEMIKLSTGLDEGQPVWMPREEGPAEVGYIVEVFTDDVVVVTPDGNKVRLSSDVAMDGMVEGDHFHFGVQPGSRIRMKSEDGDILTVTVESVGLGGARVRVPGADKDAPAVYKTLSFEEAQKGVDRMSREVRAPDQEPTISYEAAGAPRQTKAAAPKKTSAVQDIVGVGIDAADLVPLSPEQIQQATAAGYKVIGPESETPVRVAMYMVPGENGNHSPVIYGSVDGGKTYTLANNRLSMRDIDDAPATSVQAVGARAVGMLNDEFGMGVSNSNAVLLQGNTTLGQWHRMAYVSEKGPYGVVDAAKTNAPDAATSSAPPELVTSVENMLQDPAFTELDVYDFIVKNEEAVLQHQEAVGALFQRYHQTERVLVEAQLLPYLLNTRGLLDAYKVLRNVDRQEYFGRTFRPRILEQARQALAARVTRALVKEGDSASVATLKEDILSAYNNFDRTTRIARRFNELVRSRTKKTYTPDYYTGMDLILAHAAANKGKTTAKPSSRVEKTRAKAFPDYTPVNRGVGKAHVIPFTETTVVKRTTVETGDILVDPVSSGTRYRYEGQSDRVALPTFTRTLYGQDGSQYVVVLTLGETVADVQGAWIDNAQPYKRWLEETPEKNIEVLQIYRVTEENKGAFVAEGIDSNTTELLGVYEIAPGRAKDSHAPPVMDLLGAERLESSADYAPLVREGVSALDDQIPELANLVDEYGTPVLDKDVTFGNVASLVFDANRLPEPSGRGAVQPAVVTPAPEAPVVDAAPVEAAVGPQYSRPAPLNMEEGKSNFGQFRKDIPITDAIDAIDRSGGARRYLETKAEDNQGQSAQTVAQYVEGRFERGALNRVDYLQAVRDSNNRTVPAGEVPAVAKVPEELSTKQQALVAVEVDRPAIRDYHGAAAADATRPKLEGEPGRAEFVNDFSVYFESFIESWDPQGTVPIHDVLTTQDGSTVFVDHPKLTRDTPEGPVEGGPARAVNIVETVDGKKEVQFARRGQRRDAEIVEELNLPVEEAARLFSEALWQRESEISRTDSAAFAAPMRWRGRRVRVGDDARRLGEAAWQDIDGRPDSQAIADYVQQRHIVDSIKEERLRPVDEDANGKKLALEGSRRARAEHIRNTLLALEDDAASQIASAEKSLTPEARALAEKLYTEQVVESVVLAVVDNYTRARKHAKMVFANHRLAADAPGAVPKPRFMGDPLGFYYVLAKSVLEDPGVLDARIAEGVALADDLIRERLAAVAPDLAWNTPDTVPVPSEVSRVTLEGEPVIRREPTPEPVAPEAIELDAAETQNAEATVDIDAETHRDVNRPWDEEADVDPMFEEYWRSKRQGRDPIDDSSAGGFSGVEDIITVLGEDTPLVAAKTRLHMRVSEKGVLSWSKTRAESAEVSRAQNEVYGPPVYAERVGGKEYGPDQIARALGVINFTDISVLADFMGQRAASIIGRHRQESGAPVATLSELMDIRVTETASSKKTQALKPEEAKALIDTVNDGSFTYPPEVLRQQEALIAERPPVRDVIEAITEEGAPREVVVPASYEAPTAAVIQAATRERIDGLIEHLRDEGYLQKRKAKKVDPNTGEIYTELVDNVPPEMQLEAVTAAMSPYLTTIMLSPKYRKAASVAVFNKITAKLDSIITAGGENWQKAAAYKSRFVRNKKEFFSQLAKLLAEETKTDKGVALGAHQILSLSDNDGFPLFGKDYSFDIQQITLDYILRQSPNLMKEIQAQSVTILGHMAGNSLSKQTGRQAFLNAARLPGLSFSDSITLSRDTSRINEVAQIIIDDVTRVSDDGQELVFKGASSKLRYLPGRRNTPAILMVKDLNELAAAVGRVAEARVERGEVPINPRVIESIKRDIESKQPASPEVISLFKLDREELKAGELSPDAVVARSAEAKRQRALSKITEDAEATQVIEDLMDGTVINLQFYVSRGLNRSLREQAKTILAFSEMKKWQQAFNAVRAGKTAESLGTHKNNILGNIFVWTLATGNPFTLRGMLDNHKLWREYLAGEKVPAELKEMFDAISRTETMSSAAPVELGGKKLPELMFPKELGTLAPDSLLSRRYAQLDWFRNKLLDAYGVEDNIFKLHMAMFSYRELQKQIAKVDARAPKAKDSIFQLQFSEKRYVSVAKLDPEQTQGGYAARVFMPGEDGGGVAGRFLTQEQLNDLVAKAAGWDAEKYFVNYKNLGTWANYVRRSALGPFFLNSFYSWQSRTTFLPFAAKGLPGHVLDGPVYFKTSSPEVVRYQSRQGVKAAMRRFYAMQLAQASVAQSATEFEDPNVGKLSRDVLERLLGWDTKTTGVHLFSKRGTDNINAYNLSGSNVFDASSYITGFFQNIPLTLMGSRGDQAEVLKLEDEIAEETDEKKRGMLEARLRLMKSAISQDAAKPIRKQIEDVAFLAEGIAMNLYKTLYYGVISDEDARERRRRESRLINTTVSPFFGNSIADALSGAVEAAVYTSSAQSGLDLSKKLRRSGMGGEYRDPVFEDGELVGWEWNLEALGQVLGYAVTRGLSITPTAADSETLLRLDGYKADALKRQLSTKYKRPAQTAKKNVTDKIDMAEEALDKLRDGSEEAKAIENRLEGLYSQLDAIEKALADTKYFLKGFLSPLEHAQESIEIYLNQKEQE